MLSMLGSSGRTFPPEKIRENPTSQQVDSRIDLPASHGILSPRIRDGHVPDGGTSGLIVVSTTWLCAVTPER